MSQSMSNFPFEEQLSDCVSRFSSVPGWAVSCGSALRLHGLDYEPHDLDFFAGSTDAYKMADKLQDVPAVFPFEWRASGIFASHFGRFLINGVEVDVVGDFSVNRQGHIYLWDAQHPCWSRLEIIEVGGLRIPLFSLEDLLLVYLALPEEEMKVEMICEALRSRGYDRSYLQQLLGPALVEEAGLETLIYG